jgi:hypothetical protein
LKLLNLKFNLTGVKKFRFKLDIIYNTEKYILVFFSEWMPITTDQLN